MSGTPRDDAPDAEPAPLVRTSLPPEVLAEIRGAIVEARAAAEQRAAAAGPLRELAEALRANAAAMERMQETQERLARSVDRGDRSEAVLQSTQALNETFRGVRRAQDALVGRLEAEQKRPLRAAVLGAAVALLAAGGATAFFVLRQDRFQGRVDALRTELLQALAAAPAGGDGGGAEAELLRSLAGLEQRAARSEAGRDVAERELEEIRASLAALRDERDALAVRERQAAERVSRQGALEEEIARLRRDLAAERDVARENVAALAKAEAELERLRTSDGVAAPGTVAAGTEVPPPGTPERPVGGDGAAEAAAVPPHGDAKSPPAISSPEALPATAVTAGAEVARLLAGLNRLLGHAEGRDRWTFVSARAAEGSRLVDAVLETRDPEGVETRRFEAREARLTLRPEHRSLEIRMRGGSVRYMGRVSVPFLDGAYTAQLTVDPAPVRDAAHPLVETARE